VGSSLGRSRRLGAAAGCFTSPSDRTSLELALLTSADGMERTVVEIDGTRNSADEGDEERQAQYEGSD
jgi:hypothetical protein